ncbi:hypothetical protein [Marinagarivorans algicola]|uniref:hypothetical protein n=1 Tax=Marinagarivorans algicola TaxID=1513270 RepID=UPI0037370C83
MIDITAIDNHLGQHGQFNLLDWILAKNLVSYSNYEQWRYGKSSYLSPAMQLDKKQLHALIKASNTLCKKLKLCNEFQPLIAWDNQQQKSLKIDSDSTIQEAFCQRWLRPQDVPQLDLFMDNAAIVAENTLCNALTHRQFDVAHTLITTLTELNPNNPTLGEYQGLLLYSQHITQNTLIAPETLSSELAGLEDEVVPIARHVLGHGARDYLAVAWQRIARQQQGAPYNPRQPKHHASYALAQIPDWQSVSQVLLNDPSTFEHVELIARLADAFYALNDNAKSRFCWVLACERYPQAAEAIIEATQPMSVLPLWEDYCDANNDDWPESFFASFILAREPALLYQSEYFPAFNQTSTQLVANLMHKKLAGDDEINARQHIQHYSHVLLNIVMGT